MGCGISVKQDSLTEEDKALIRESWQQFCDGDVVEDGKHLFIKMFEKLPEVKQVFYFKKDCKVSMKMFGQNRQFDTHVSKVFEMLGILIDDLDNKKSLENRLIGLGSTHAKFAIKKEYFMMFGECLLYCLERKLGDKLTPEVRDAWIHFMNYITPLVLAGWTKALAKLQGQG